MNTPAIKATFELDEVGRPTAVGQGNLQHYNIKLSVDGAPDDTYAVTYLLDSSYYSDVREVRNADDGFEERLTSYGDYTVQAKIRARDGVTTVAVPLSTALALGHGSTPTDAVAAALRNIETH